MPRTFSAPAASASNNSALAIHSPHLVWRSSMPPPKLGQVLASWTGMTMWFAVLGITMLALTLLLVTPFVLLRGEDWRQTAAGWLSPELWWGGLGIAVALGTAPVLLGLALSTVEAYAWNADTQQLTTTERRSFLPPVKRHWQLGDITAVVPTLGIHGGSLEVTLRNAAGTTHHLSLGQGLTPSTLQAHADWLRQQLGDRVLPMVESYGD